MKAPLKTYQVLYPVEDPPKVSRTEPYRAVPCSGKAPVDYRIPLKELRCSVNSKNCYYYVVTIALSVITDRLI